MKCKHPYYRYDGLGVLRCTTCGEPSPKEGVHLGDPTAKASEVIEDKVMATHETKGDEEKIIPPEVKREKTVVKKGK